MTTWRHDDGYAEVARVTGDEVFHAKRPFEVQITPDRLVAKLRGSGRLGQPAS